MEPTCPSARDLEHFLLGELPDERIDAVERHLTGCPACMRALEASRPSDSLLDAARGGPDAASAVARAAALSERLAPTVSDTVPLGPPRYEFLNPPCQPDELGRLGTYRVLAVLGQGGMGLVFRGEDTLLGREVALKVVRPERADRPDAQAYLLREARALAALEHRRIVPIWQVGELPGGGLFLAMPLLRGESLEDRLGRERLLTPGEVRRIGMEVAEGLAAAHAAGIVHRDVKPANVWLDIGTAAVTLLDFGLAHPAGDASRIMGTPGYMAPEQARGQAGPAADLFGLGCLLYRAATGLPPFTGDTPAALVAAIARPPAPAYSVRPYVGKELSALIDRLLAPEATDRPASASAVAEALRPPPTVRPARRAPMLLGILFAAAAGLAALSLALSPWHWFEKPPAPVPNEPATAPPEPPPAPPARVPPTGQCWLDQIRPEDIPAADRVDTERLAPVPKELVAMLGDGRLMHWSRICGTEFSADDARLIVRLQDHRFRLWDVRTGRGLDIRQPPGKGSFGWSLAADRVARTDPADPKRVGLYEMNSGKFLRTLSEGAPPGFLVMTRDGGWLVAIRNDGSFTLWDLGSATPPVTRAGPPPPAIGLPHTLSPDGRLLGCVFPGGRLRVIDTTTGTPAYETARAGVAFYPLPFLHDGRLIMPIDNQLQLLSTKGEPLRRLLPDRKVTGAQHIALSPDGKVCAVAAGASLTLADVESGRALHALDLRPDSQVVEHVSFSPSGKLLAVSWFRHVRLWDVAGGQEVTPGGLPAGWGTGMGFSPDGKTFHAGTNDGFWTTWDLTVSPPRAARRVRTHRLGKHYLAAAAGGSAVATSADGEAPQVWDAATGAPLTAVRAEGPVLALSPDGGWLVVGDGNQTRLHDIRNPAAPAEVALPAGFSFSPHRAAFSPDGKRLAACAGSGISLADLGSDRPVRRIEHRPAKAKAANVHRLQFHPTGRTLGTLGGGVVMQWDATTGELAALAELKGGPYAGFAYAPDGRRAFTITPAGDVHEHDLTGGERRFRFKAVSGAATPETALLVSPDGRHLVHRAVVGIYFLYRLAPPGPATR